MKKAIYVMFAVLTMTAISCNQNKVSDDVAYNDSVVVDSVNTDSVVCDTVVCDSLN